MQLLVPAPCCNPCCPTTLLNLTTLIQEAVEQVECCSSLSVDTLVDLKDVPALARVDGMIKDMLGYYAAFDGLGKSWVWKATDMSPPDDTTVVVPNDSNPALPGRWLAVVG